MLVLVVLRQGRAKQGGAAVAWIDQAQRGGLGMTMCSASRSGVLESSELFKDGLDTMLS